MKKVIFAFVIFFLSFFLIGLFFAGREKNSKILKSEEKKENSITSLETTSSSNLSGGTDASFILEFERKVNEDVSKLTEGIKPDENKTINDYRGEIAKIQQKFNSSNDTQKSNPDTLIEIAQELSKINPPPLLYSIHLDLIKAYYKLGLALKELSITTDQTKKLLLYNLIKTTLEKIKL